MQAIGQYVAAHWGWFVLVAVPFAIHVLTVINGMLPFNSGGRRWIGFIVDVLSYGSRSNSPGTWKMPGTLSRPPGSEPPPLPPAPPALLLFPLVALLALSQAGCCVFRGNCKEGSLGACTSEVLAAQGPQAIPLIIQIVRRHGIDADIVELAKLEGKAIAKELLPCFMDAIFSRSDAKLTQIKRGNLAASPEPWLNVPVDDLEKQREWANTWRVKYGPRK